MSKSNAKALKERAANRPGLVKASAPCWSKQWARDAYGRAVEEGGGASVVGRREGKDESTIRARSHDDRIDPRLSECVAGLGCYGIRALCEELLQKADELEALEEPAEAERRAG